MGAQVSRRQALSAALGASALGLPACLRGDRPPRIGVAFETLQTEYWVASFDIMKAAIEKRGFAALEAISDGDANRQLEQVHSFAARRVDGIIVAPKDGHTVIPMIKAANRRGIPIVVYNRAPARSAARSINVGVDNFTITKNTVLHMCELARSALPARGGKRHKALILMGDLGDLNAIGRRDGFEAAVAQHPDLIEVVTRVPTEWNQEKALAGLVNGLQAHPDISFVFTSSDFLLPSIRSALSTAGKWKPIGDPQHVILGAFDGDATAYRMLKDGFLDADGVQDAYYQSEVSVASILDARAGKPVPENVFDPGLVVHQANLATAARRMWGAQLVPRT